MAIYISAAHEGKILLVDFDDTLAEFQGVPPEVPGNPVLGVLEFLPKLYEEGWLIHIFSGRSGHPQGTEQIAAWMDKYQLPYHAIVPGKPHYDIIVDDQAISPKEHTWASIYEKIHRKEVGLQASAPGSKNFSYSSVQVVLPKNIGDKLVAWGKKNIPDDILNKEEGGLEDYPHITVKYGIHSESPKEVLELLKNEKSVKFKLGKVSLFKNEDKPFDVVKVEIISPDLHRLNKKISENVEVTDTFPNYVPHATIAYVHKGKADQLEGSTELEGLEAEVDSLEFSSSKKKKGATPIQLQAAFLPSFVNAPTNRWGPEDVVIPTRPEWADCESTWHFPYVKRHDDTDMVLSQILDVDKEASSPFRENVIKQHNGLERPSGGWEDLNNWIVQYTFYSRKYVNSLKSEAQAKAIALRLYEQWRSQSISKTSPTQLELPGLDKGAGPKELALGLGLALTPTLPSSTPTSQDISVNQTSPIGWTYYESTASQAAAKYQIPIDMFLRLLKTENDIGNPNAVNPSTGATGLAQFLPQTAQELGVNPKDPIASIHAAAKYLRALHREFGDWEKAVRAYNWGPGNVARSTNPKNDPKETKEYVQKIKPSKKAMQPNTTWDGNEPFSPLPTNWELHTDDGLASQQYSRQYKAMRDNPYWDNLGLIFNFMMDEHDKRDMFQVASFGPDYIIIKALQKKAQTNLYHKAKSLIQQLKESLTSTQNVAFKAEQLISRLEDQLQDAETEQQAITAVQSTIGYLEELGTATNSIVQKLQQLLKADLEEPTTKILSHKELDKKAEVYTDKEQEDLYAKTREDSKDHYRDDVGGGNTPHSWNDDTNDYPQPKDMQKGYPLDQLVPVDRRFDQQINPPTSSPADFIKAPTSDGDMGDYDYKKWKKADLISYRELHAANLIDLVWVRVQTVSDDFTEIKGQANLLGKVIPWTAKALPTSGDLRMYKIDNSEIEKAISRASITAPHRREQLERVTEKIREQLRAVSSVTYRDVPTEEQINQMWESIPKIWWTKEESTFWGKKKGTQTTTLKLDYLKDLLRRNKFDSNYFDTFPNGRNDKFSWTLVGQSMLLTKY